MASDLSVVVVIGLVVPAGNVANLEMKRLTQGSPAAYNV